MPTVKALLAEAAGRGVSRLDARLLLSAAAGLAQAEIIAEPEAAVAGPGADIFRTLITRRAAGEPVSRILGAREFYGRSFCVSPAVLDPRPDTETLIDAALGLPRPLRLIDLGTGSGILAVTLLAEWPEATGLAVDVSADALAVARENAATHGVAGRLGFHHGSWFDGVEGSFDLIVSNPPYIPRTDIDGLAPEVRDHDPHLALMGGDDGLDAYRQIAATASRHMDPGAHVLVEIGAGQASDVTAIFGDHGFTASGQWRDLGGHMRVLAFSRP